MNIFNLISKFIARLIFNHRFLIYKKSFLNKEVIFDIDYKNKFNLGDTLFLIPLISELKKNKFSFKFKVNNSQKSLINFYVPNIEFINNIENKKDVIIVRSINVFKVKDYFNNVIFFDTTSKFVDEKLSIFIARNFFKFFQIDFDRFNFNFKVSDNFNISSKILFSDEINSGFFRLNKTHFKKIYKIVEQYYNMGFEVYRLSNNDKYQKYIKFKYHQISKSDNLHPFLLDIHNKKFLKIIAFDTFISHISCINNIDTHIIMRNFNKRYTIRLKKYYFPIIPSQNANVSFN